MGKSALGRHEPTIARNSERRAHQRQELGAPRCEANSYLRVRLPIHQVLRPALLSGLVYACGLCSFLYAMVALPYAIGYGLGTGGSLAVSLLWGTCVFGEAATAYNRRCVAWSFLGILVGVVLLGASA